MNLETWGWDEFLERHAMPFREQGLAPARVIRVERLASLVQDGAGERAARVSGKFLHEMKTRGGFPAVGDWVMVGLWPSEARATIHAILPRRTCFSRKRPGETTEEQVLAANVDTALIVAALDGGRSANPNSLERYLALVRESGAAPVIVLNKLDLCEEPDRLLPEIEAVANGAPVHAISAAEKTNLDALRPYLAPGRTAVLLGASGVGKSALTNALLGEERQATGEVRESDRRGRHTTSQRELIALPEGGLIIDTPGLREIQLWLDEDAMAKSFSDIAELAAACRFRDCRHEEEPGCAIQQALADGRLESRRFGNYLRLKREQAYLEQKVDIRARLAEKDKWKKISQWSRQITKGKRSG